MEVIAGDLVLILSFVLGIGFLVLEAVFPGFGVAGVVGIVLEFVAITFAWLRHGLTDALIVTLLALIIIVVTVILTYRSFVKGRLSRSQIVLQEEEHGESAQPALAACVGKKATCATPLRPAGFVDIDGQRWNARSSGDFLPRGSAVRVTGVEGDHLLVQEQSASGK